ncbi:MAG: aminotransferase class I/II-fold pyridoxal phosphate-dependent enzyme, partial [Novosphingobium sp.]|nr:aminotransferase class I/II-fold pyridoxal phosphate-dependent enzyme [Novosphingobium sp.]
RSITEMISSLPDGCILLLDEAYGEYAPPGVLPPIDTSDPRVLRFRTFSKAYGMAGARVGYCIGEAQLISEFEKVRDHYGMNRTAEIGAVAALADQEWLASVVERTTAARERIAQIARDNGLAPIASATNFVTIDCLRDTAYAKSVMEGVLSRGVFIRMPGVDPLSRCIRVSAGFEHDLDIFAEVLADTLKALR